MPGNTIADMEIIPDTNMYAINNRFKLSYLIEKLLPLLVTGLK